MIEQAEFGPCLEFFKHLDAVQLSPTLIDRLKYKTLIEVCYNLY